MKKHEALKQILVAQQGQWRLVDKTDYFVITHQGRVFWQQRKRKRQRFA